mgnify:FL=1
MFKHIDIQQLRELRAQKNVNIADTRDKQSYDTGHISNAVHLDNDSLAQFINDTPFEEPLVVCCYHGNSSQGAADYLSQQGFREVYSLDGGFELFKVSQPDDVSQG